jgi:hypothetical protein
MLMARGFGALTPLGVGIDSVPNGYSDPGRGFAPAMHAGGVAGRVRAGTVTGGIVQGVGVITGAMQGQATLAGAIQRVRQMVGAVLGSTTTTGTPGATGVLVGAVRVGAPPDTESIADAVLGNRIYPNGPTLAEAIEDILNGINQGSAGVTTQQIRDAMALALSGNINPAAGSIDKKLEGVSGQPFIDAD